jgi:stalled ribosome rescue protein Dom34
VLKKRRTMKKQTGIWIDTQKAFVIRLLDSSHTVKTITSHIESKVRIPGESKEYSRFGVYYFDDQEKKQHRQQRETKEYLREVLRELKDDDELVIFGPAGMKKELEKFIRENKNLKFKLKDVATADSMTENQMIAWVRNYYKSCMAES